MAPNTYADTGQDFYADLASRLRDIEERIRLMKDRTLLIGKGFVDEKEKTFQEIQNLKKAVLELKQENIKMKNFIQNIAEQIDSAARKSELEVLQRQFDLFRKE